MRSLVFRLMVASSLFTTAVESFAQATNCSTLPNGCPLPEPAGLELLAIGGVAAIAATLIRRRLKK